MFAFCKKSASVPPKHLVFGRDQLKNISRNTHIKHITILCLSMQWVRSTSDLTGNMVHPINDYWKRRSHFWHFHVHFLGGRFKRENEIPLLTLNVSPQLWRFLYYKIKNTIGIY